MRCVICNEELRDFEATRKDPYTKQFLDTCNQCWKATKIASLDNYDLMSEADRAELDEVDEFDIDEYL
jgi:hypothetical protein